eukprot:2835395-Rhodomonas_salina.1
MIRASLAETRRPLLLRSAHTLDSRRTLDARLDSSLTSRCSRAPVSASLLPATLNGPPESVEGPTHGREAA